MLMMRGFTVAMWTQTWKRRLDPLVSGPNDTQIPLTHRYELIKAQFFDEDEAYRMSILGPDLLRGASPDYWELSTFFASPVQSYREWLSYSTEERGKLSAFHQLDNMRKIIEQHMLEMNRRMKRHLDERKKAFEELTGTSSKSKKSNNRAYLGQRRPKGN